MLPKNYRLPLRAEFARIRKVAKVFPSPFFSFLAAKNPNTDTLSRFAFVVPLKTDKRSVYRHRAKRLFTEAVRALLSEIKTGFEVVFVIKKEAVGKNLDEIKMEVEKVCRTAGLL